ncbi:MAG: ATP-binding cassette, subfamily bacterial [Acetobacteraceae bacterium]|jgi:ATP-binding cassette subfamily B protein|nr:ATP-binding cassette, subfamily bacterial [Acetobacteraceae bacterium]
MRHAVGASAPSIENFPALRGRPLGFLWSYVRRHPAGHLTILLSVLLAVTCSVSTQYGMKYLIDIVSLGRDAAGNQVWTAFALLCGLVAADNLSWRVGSYAAHRTFVAVTGDIRGDLFRHLAGHSPAYFAERLPGALASRITSTANAAFTLESTGAWNVLPPAIALVLSICFIGSVNLPLAGTLTAIAVALGVVVYYMARKGSQRHRDYATKAAVVDGEMVDIISNFNVVRAFGATFREQRRIAGRMDTEMASRRRSLYYLEHIRLVHAVLTAFLTAGVIAWGIILWQNGHAKVGDLVLITALAFGILHGTRDLAVSLVDLTQHVARLEEAISALLTPHDMNDLPDAEPLPTGRGEVVFEQVRFAYAGRSSVLDRFDLMIAPGERVGLVGLSGAGKSTVLGLLQRFYDVSGGRISIDGHDIRDVTQKSLRDVMAVVPQDISLFHRSVMENIRYARPGATEADVLAAAGMAHCREFIEAMPDGFDTMVGDRGVKLSGGQRQRLAIARALLKNAPILLLDEATSALDTESEQAIQHALDRLMAGRTVIAIAHRLSTLQSFDRIIVMAKGRIVDDGSPAELAARPGPYRELLRKQRMEPMETAAAA